jgi:hypothetical protein
MHDYVMKKIYIVYDAERKGMGVYLVWGYLPMK